MYNNNTRGGFKRPDSNRFSSSRSPSDGGSRFGFNPQRPSSGGPSRYGGGFNRGGGGGRKAIKTVDPRLLVKKAELIEEEAYVPVTSIEALSINNVLKQNILGMGYKHFTPIQDKAIPEVLLGKDVVGVANTGTGKTAAFLIPTLNAISADRNKRALIITPTRELADQIVSECIKLGRGMGIFTQLCIGGMGIYPQKQGLKRRPNIVIGTPGRLKDLNQQGALDFNVFSIITLDEVDRMLDMGFIPDITYITQRLPQVKQSLFFSATLSSEVRQVMNGFLKDPVIISIKTQETSKNVDQDIVKVAGRVKIDVLDELLRQTEVSKVIIFGRTKHGIEKLAEALYNKNHKVASIHGDKSQGQRKRALEVFKRGEVDVLLATDVASRGLDIPNVTHVINYDLPENYDDYVHRIGRTGRAGKKGNALSFVD
jgi:ATP-dependent RNA helicase RhlE